MAITLSRWLEEIDSEGELKQHWPTVEDLEKEIFSYLIGDNHLDIGQLLTIVGMLILAAIGIGQVLTEEEIKEAIERATEHKAA
jgi:hypothetical protein